MTVRLRRWFLLLWVSAVCFLPACKGGVPVAFTVDGVPVEKDELICYMRDNASAVAAEIERRFAADSADEGFWDRDCGEVVPLEYLKAYTAEQIARTKVEQILAREQGIETAMTWTQQHKDLEEQSRRRREAYEAGEVVYGSIERDFFAYSADMLYTMRAAVQEKLGLTAEGYAALVDERLKAAQIRYEDMAVSADDIA